MKIEAYKCGQCGNIYEFEKELGKHEINCKENKLSDAIGDLFFTKVLYEDGWEIENKETTYEDDIEMDYEHFPKASSFSDIDKIERFEVDANKNVIEKIIYVRKKKNENKKRLRNK